MIYKPMHRNKMLTYYAVKKRVDLNLLIQYGAQMVLEKYLSLKSIKRAKQDIDAKIQSLNSQLEDAENERVTIEKILVALESSSSGGSEETLYSPSKPPLADRIQKLIKDRAAPLSLAEITNALNEPISSKPTISATMARAKDKFAKTPEGWTLRNAELELKDML